MGSRRRAGRAPPSAGGDCYSDGIVKSRRNQDDVPKGLTHNPFAALRPDGAAPPPPPEPAPEADPTGTDEREPQGRLVVRREKKGRAGKTVTRVSGLALDPGPLAELAREMKRALGCGASVEAPDILLQGALTDRAAKWLEKRLGTRVTIGN